MAVKSQVVTDAYAIYNGDCVEVMRSLPDQSADMAMFSPPFADLYCYSDHPADVGNCRDYDEFFVHFRFVIAQLARIVKPGRICAVHCMDIPAMERPAHRSNAHQSSRPAAQAIAKGFNPLTRWLA